MAEGTTLTSDSVDAAQLFNILHHDAWFDANRQLYLAELEALRGSIPSQGVGVEIGVGTGRFAASLGITVGVEPSPGMAELARKRGVGIIEGVAEVGINCRTYGGHAMTYAELLQALQVLGLGERATLREIKTRHRELVKLHHPDTGSPASAETIRKVNAAYRVLQDYITAYSFSFAEEEFFEQNQEERLRRQFMDDPLWGKG